MKSTEFNTDEMPDVDPVAKARVDKILHGDNPAPAPAPLAPALILEHTPAATDKAAKAKAADAQKTITISPEPEVLAAIQAAALDDERPVSVWLARFLRKLHKAGKLTNE